jgi:spore coat polysaccharide biosynthesis predicted glycosyltransferase SpsG
VVVADGRATSGLGHLSRSAAVAAALRSRGLTVACAALGAERDLKRDVDWVAVPNLAGCPPPRTRGAVVLDSYDVAPGAVRSVFPVARLVVMHDRGIAPGEADLVVSVSAAPAPGVLAGPKYACLRPAFWGLPPSVEDPSRMSVLVTGGAGAAPIDLAAAVADEGPGLDVVVVEGPLAVVRSPLRGRVRTVSAPASLLELLRDAGLVITAAGQTLLEALACGKPTIALITAENQRRQAEIVAAAGAAILVDPPEVPKVAGAAAGLAADPATRDRLSHAAQRVVDGYGALRVAFAIAALIADG